MTDQPNWMREIDVALAAHPQVAVTGNIHDQVLLPNPNPAAPFPIFSSVTDATASVLRSAGHSIVLAFHPAAGSRIVTGGSDAAAIIGRAVPDQSELDALGELIDRVVRSETPCCLIIEGASRLATNADFTDNDLHRLLVAAEHLAGTARSRRVEGSHNTPLYNTVFWLLDRQTDLPHWLIGTDLMRVVSVPLPGIDTRMAAAEVLHRSLPGGGELDADQRRAVVKEFGARTGGLTLRSITEIGRLAIDRQIPVTQIDAAIRTYRVGIPDNPWSSDALKDQIRLAHRTLSAEVRGQGPAVQKAVDILIRSAMGLSGAQTSSSSGRPQGVMFFAGPTGVGKTELAKRIAELVFGRIDAILRFDMSEFSSEHSEARLIGAPPGYTGHSSGGELTNGVREDPFRLILFDEIEKAHPRILDKFLQILEDGRLTDGAGSTVYFSESLIVFTSNLGIYRDTPSGRVPVVAHGSPYAEVESKVREAITEHFTTQIGRPELLNRLGDNIVVFDFISREVARELVPVFIANVVARVESATGRTVRCAPAVTEQIVQHASARLEFGGRGVASAVETMLVNPLARALFHDEGAGDFVVNLLVEQEEGWVVR